MPSGQPGTGDRSSPLASALQGRPRPTTTVPARAWHRRREAASTLPAAGALYAAITVQGRGIRWRPATAGRTAPPIEPCDDARPARAGDAEAPGVEVRLHHGDLRRAVARSGGRTLGHAHQLRRPDPVDGCGHDRRSRPSHEAGPRRGRSVASRRRGRARSSRRPTCAARPRRRVDRTVGPGSRTVSSRQQVQRRPPGHRPRSGPSATGVVDRASTSPAPGRPRDVVAHQPRGRRARPERLTRVSGGRSVRLTMTEPWCGSACSAAATSAAPLVELVDGPARRHRGPHRPAPRGRPGWRCAAWPRSARVELGRRRAHPRRRRRSSTTRTSTWSSRSSAASSRPAS